MKTIPLTTELLLYAYTHGIFPMGVNGRIEWFSPDPRAIFDLDDFHVPRSLRQTWRSGKFEIRINTAFGEVIRACGHRREGTWITHEIINAYTRLHELGFAHSVESWRDEELAGGLYGVAIGGAFFGESMFHRVTDASKVALVALVERMRARGFTLLDTQFTTPHLARFNVKEIPAEEYLRRLQAALQIEASFVD